MYAFLVIVILIALLAVCLMQLSKLGVIDLPMNVTPPGKADETKSDE